MSPAKDLVLEVAAAWEQHGQAPSPVTLERALLALGAALADARTR